MRIVFVGLVSLILSPAVSAFELDLGDTETKARLDSTFSTGFSIRAQDRNDALIGISNGGDAYSINGDNGNLNYDQGDLFSLNNKLTSELDIQYRNLGAFARGSFFYDYVVMLMSTRRTDLSDSAKDRRLGWDARLLDAYVSANLNLGSSLLSLRAGNMVLNWGESTFIQNGINTINPVDVSKLRVAGSELKEALTPVPMLNVNLQVNQNLSFEAFYQFVWRQTEIDPEGTYFSTNDFASPGGQNVFLGFGLPGINDNPPTLSSGATIIGTAVARGPDHRADNSAQFGFAARYFSPELNETEFAFYFTQLHSRLPLIGLTTGTEAALEGGNYAGSAEYFNEYPRDLRTFGLSFNTQLDFLGVALQGEATYKPDQPIQIDDVELLLAGLSPAEQGAIGLLTKFFTDRGDPADIAEEQAEALVPDYGSGQLGTLGYGERVRGYRKKDVIQAQLTATKIFGPNLGADQIVFLTEWGGTFIKGMESKGRLRYEGPGTYRSGDAGVMASFTPGFQQNGLPAVPAETDGFGDQFSWGYRALLRATYDNAIGAISVSPTLAFSHDVMGTTPLPISNFVEGRMVLTPSLGFSYLENLRAAVSYTAYFGGGRYNLISDRDFVTANMSYSF